MPSRKVISAAGRPASVPSSSPSWRCTGSGQEMPFSARWCIRPRKNGRSSRVDALLVERQDEGARRTCAAGNSSSPSPRRCPCRRAASPQDIPAGRFRARLRKRRCRPPCGRSAVDEGHVGLGEFDVAQRAHDREILRLGRGDGKVDVTSKRARKASMISSTMISGADAPADRPSVAILPIRSQGISRRAARAATFLRRRARRLRQGAWNWTSSARRRPGKDRRRRRFPSPLPGGWSWRSRSIRRPAPGSRESVPAARG